MIYISALVIVTGMAYAWYFFCTDYQYLIAASTRRRLFEIRNELFDAVMDKKLSFDNKAYGMTRKTINGLIAGCDNLGLFQIIITICIHRLLNDSFKKLQDDYQHTLNEAMNELDDAGKKLINDIRREMHKAVLKHAVKSSAILWPFLFAIMVVAGFFNRVNSLVKYVMDFFSRKKFFVAIDTHAKAHGI